ncbi:PQQ-binding-like beta-propeller repeat protein [Ktedonobacter racemifer]|uniref:Serine/threonine protein kinase n=1 Tax=Ktedonobacter racemifer DSM 44963 TaxID=485913 RepID=D6TMQ0_KTERA|nr:serine/threonine-protein kinase [Ktedonobacter racemifer]EFH87050.1 serine/threonine protein kinase [Ktedonobacter racemifer DSM 44963]
MADRTNRAGQYIGDYQLLRRLGDGGFGDVYLGEHKHTHAQAAVKVLHARLAGSDELKEFINEARTFRLRHPHITQLLDFGIDSDEIPYLVMDYASHGTLRGKHPKGTQVSLFTVLSYIAPLASALQYAHDQHLIHRDVKPENMLLGAHDNVLLSDFGIAVVAHSSRSLNTHEGINGTLPYMAPEQLRGKPCPASDQYALAIVVYEWLTGNRPFKGTAIEIAMQHQMTLPASLREQVPTLSIEVEQVVLTALAKEPDKRFASVMAFAKALQQASEVQDTPPCVVPLPSSLNTLPLSGVAVPIPTEEPVKVAAPLERESVFTNKLLSPPIYTQPASPYPTHELIKAAGATAIPQSAVPSRTSLSVSSPRGKRRVRPLALFLIGLAVLAIIGSIGLSEMTTLIPTHHANATATAQMIAGETATVKAVTTVTASTYNQTATTNGIMFGFDSQRTRNNPFEHTLNATTVPGLKIAWTSSPTGSFIGSSPAVVNGVVYVGSNDHKLYAYRAVGCNMSSCSPLWSSNPTGGIINSSPAVINGVVYIGSDDHRLYAYKAEGCGSGISTCSPLWSSDPTGQAIESSPAVINGVVYVGSNDHKLYAYKAEGCGASTCSPLWSSDLTGGIIYSSPAVANGIVYAGSNDRRLYAYKAEGCGSGISTCSPLWSSNPTGNLINSSPAVANGIVYVSSHDHKLYAYKAAGCGTSLCPPLWTSSPTGDFIYSSPAVANGIVYVSSHDHKLYAYKAGGCGTSICAPLWSSNPTDGWITSSPTVANDVVYVGSDDHRLYAYKADGCGTSICAPLWSSNPTGGWITSSPTVANGVVYVGSNDHKLYAYHL